jgi:phenylpropionate dioxygenase-like ring-hydroxylating dioxygenase large terminal subunit
MYHGLLYNASGAVTEIPGPDVIRPQAKARSYPIVDRHSWIWVWMGEASAADETLIPPAVGLDDPNFILGSGQLDYAAEARLINDNLLDLSHLSYIHASSLPCERAMGQGAAESHPASARSEGGAAGHRAAWSAGSRLCAPC